MDFIVQPWNFVNLQKNCWLSAQPSQSSELILINRLEVYFFFINYQHCSINQRLLIMLICHTSHYKMILFSHRSPFPSQPDSHTPKKSPIFLSFNNNNKKSNKRILLVFTLSACVFFVFKLSNVWQQAREREKKL